MNKINIILDRHFPYDYIKNYNEDNNLIINKIEGKSKVPLIPLRLYHIFDLYLRSFHSHFIFGNRRTTLLLGLLYHLYKPKKVTLVGYEIIFNLKNSLRHKLVILFWRLAIRKIDYLVVQTQWEVKYLAEVFKTSLDKFRVIPFYTENGEFVSHLNKNGYVFAAGRMERDFTTLLNAMKNTDIPIKIVADQSQQEQLKKIKTSNTELYFNISKEKYIDLLKKAKLVVIPLYKGNASRGQVVLLEAMRYGKPVICSDVPGTREYIKDNETAWLVIAEDEKLLNKQIIEVYNDNERLLQTGKAAQNEQRNFYTPETFVNNYIKMIKKIILEKQASA